MVTPCQISAPHKKSSQRHIQHHFTLSNKINRWTIALQKQLIKWKLIVIVKKCNVININYKQHLQTMWVRRPNSVCGLSYGHPAEWPKIFNWTKLDVLKTLQRKRKTMRTYLQNIPTAASQWWQDSDKRRWPNSVCGLRFHRSHERKVSI
jgi:hypothetical protein